MSADDRGKMETGALDISIIMPVYNGKEFIIKSLPPLIGMMKRGEIREVIVVDDTSTDDTAEIARELGARVIPSGGRLGPGAARNEAAKLAKGNILWFVDADVIIHDDAASYMAEGFAAPEVVAVFGSYDDEPPAQNFLSQYKNLVHHFYHHRGRKEASTFWSGCGAVRKENFLAVGGFDVEMFKRPSIEDIELGYRLREAGGKIMLFPELQSTHLKVWRFINLIHTEIFCRAIPWSRLMIQQTGVVDDLNVSTQERMRAVLAGVAFLGLFMTIIGWLPLWSVVVLAGSVILVNSKLFMLFLKRKGLLFALMGLGFHQLYYLYSSAAFAYCLLESKIPQLKKLTE
ncbi:Mycofactocin system glycosyltransferase [hydrothermal vent metagenome]|uniref:Mycofactocin system glycosyltransferase n=1 Tax=hydrothermal vent metagenome TaxID=652676 RepID=A0A3B0ZHA6_9ZZZZ